MNGLLANPNVRDLLLLLAGTLCIAGFLIGAGWRDLRKNGQVVPRGNRLSPGAGMDAEPEESAFEHT